MSAGYNSNRSCSPPLSLYVNVTASICPRPHARTPLPLTARFHVPQPESTQNWVRSSERKGSRRGRTQETPLHCMRGLHGGECFVNARVPPIPYAPVPMHALPPCRPCHTLSKQAYYCLWGGNLATGTTVPLLWAMFTGALCPLLNAEPAMSECLFHCPGGAVGEQSAQSTHCEVRSSYREVNMGAERTGANERRCYFFPSDMKMGILASQRLIARLPPSLPPFWASERGRGRRPRGHYGGESRLTTSLLAPPLCSPLPPLLAHSPAPLLSSSELGRGGGGGRIWLFSPSSLPTAAAAAAALTAAAAASGMRARAGGRSRSGCPQTWLLTPILLFLLIRPLSYRAE